jgi:hypothetical protein
MVVAAALATCWKKTLYSHERHAAKNFNDTWSRYNGPCSGHHLCRFHINMPRQSSPNGIPTTNGLESRQRIYKLDLTRDTASDVILRTKKIGGHLPDSEFITYPLLPSYILWIQEGIHISIHHVTIRSDDWENKSSTWANTVGRKNE